MVRKRPINNKDLATLFFSFWVMFVFVFVIYPVNYVALFYAGYALMFALAFKTWDIIRGLYK